MRNSDSYDAIVIGGGPGGSTTSAVLASKGRRVVLLEKEKFDKMVAFLESPAGQRERTNNHVERTNRKLRYDEKVRYKFRSQRSLDRFLRLRLGQLEQPTPARPSSEKAKPVKASTPQKVVHACRMARAGAAARAGRPGGGGAHRDHARGGAAKRRVDSPRADARRSGTSRDAR